ncbi:MAG: hypothetical protein JJD96_08790 [Thermoleophilia bacterium]|nr:hypothetical protein [Thermoleophilia bacterium]
MPYDYSFFPRNRFTKPEPNTDIILKACAGTPSYPVLLPVDSRLAGTAGPATLRNYYRAKVKIEEKVIAGESIIATEFNEN